MVIVGNYNGYVKCAEAFLRLGLSHQVSEKSFVCGFAQVCVYHCAIDGCFTDSILGANSGHGCWHRCITLHPACSIFWILALLIVTQVIKDVRKQKHKTKKQNVKGLLGRELTSQGYVNIDGLDKSLGMLGQVRQW